MTTADSARLSVAPPPAGAGASAEGTELDAVSVAAPPRMVTSFWLGAGLPGVACVYSEGGFILPAESLRPRAMTAAGVTTSVAYGVYVRSPSARGLELGVCAPYVSFGRKHPVHGDRLSVFIPMVGSLQCTAAGGVGVSFSIPVFSPFVRLGMTVVFRSRYAAPTCARVMRRVGQAADAVERAARTVWRRLRPGRPAAVVQVVG